jgi:hypothetical protein
VRSQVPEYEITFAGRAGTVLRAEFDDCDVTIGPDTTTLRAELPDPGAPAGLMQRIAALRLEVLYVRLVASPPEQLPAVMPRCDTDPLPSRHVTTTGGSPWAGPDCAISFPAWDLLTMPACPAMGFPASPS